MAPIATQPPFRLLFMHKRAGQVSSRTVRASVPKADGGVIQAVSMVNDNTGQITYGTLPGYPEKNCPVVAGFITGPAFAGAANHWNFIHLQW